jgi:hypothetical protein
VIVAALVAEDAPGRIRRVPFIFARSACAALRRLSLFRFANLPATLSGGFQCLIKLARVGKLLPPTAYCFAVRKAVLSSDHCQRSVTVIILTPFVATFRLFLPIPPNDKAALGS